MRRLGERGTSSVMVAILLVVLMGFTALAVDMGRIMTEHSRLQAGADAAAFAIAADCVNGDCGDPNATALSLVRANTKEEDITVTLPKAPSPDDGEVTVNASATIPGMFSRVLGINSTTQSVSATAEWGSPATFTATYPFMLSYCEWLRQQTHPHELNIYGNMRSITIIEAWHDAPNKPFTNDRCNRPDGKEIVAGWAWLKTGPDPCKVTMQVGDWMEEWIPEQFPTPTYACKPYPYLTENIVTIPIYDDTVTDHYKGPGKYHIMGYATYQAKAWDFLGGVLYEYQKQLCSAGGDGSYAQDCLAGGFVTPQGGLPTGDVPGSGPRTVRLKS